MPPTPPHLPGPPIALAGLSHRYPNGTLALDGVSLALPAGSFTALLGPSGCGKSTVLRLLAGLEAAHPGQVHVPTDAGVGFVFQAPTLMPWATVQDNVALPLRLAGMNAGEAAQRVAPWLARVGLAGFERVHPGELSGGMQMRASIARALVTQPGLLLMDEPFAALDEITRQQLNDDLLALWQAQRFTTVFVTHSVYEAVYLSERVVVMSPRPGRVAADVAIDRGGLSGRAWRSAPAYAARCAELSAALEQAMAPERRP